MEPLTQSPLSSGASPIPSTSSPNGLHQGQPDSPPQPPTDSPPRKTRRSRSQTQSRDGGTPSFGADRAPRRASRKAELNIIAERLEMLLGAVSLAASLYNAQDSQIIHDGTPRLVRALVALAEQDQRVYLVLKQLSVGGAYTQVTIAALAIIMPVLANHGLIPPLFMLVIPDDATATTAPNG